MITLMTDVRSVVKAFDDAEREYGDQLGTIEEVLGLGKPEARRNETELAAKTARKIWERVRSSYISVHMQGKKVLAPTIAEMRTVLKEAQAQPQRIRALIETELRSRILLFQKNLYRSLFGSLFPTDIAVSGKRFELCKISTKINVEVTGAVEPSIVSLLRFASTGGIEFEAEYDHGNPD
jgi:hypothetical protein